MKLRPALLVVAALQTLLVSGSALAQGQAQVKLTTPNSPTGTPVIWSGTGYGSFYVSPYSGVLLSQGNKSVILNCVDFFHEVSINETWWANKTSLGGGSTANTRFNNLTWYLQAAWLTQQYGANPGANPDRTIAIQAAIWNLFASATTGVEPVKSGGSLETSQQWWIDQAVANAQYVEGYKFYVLTPLDISNPDSQQEFLVYDSSAVPEPATLTLLGTGIVGLVGVVRRRRKGVVQALPG